MLPKINHRELLSFVDVSYNTKQPLLITGAPGIGKTDAIMSYCADRGVDLIVSHPVISMPEDFKGLPVKTERVNTKTGKKDTIAEFLPFDDLAFALETEGDTVWFFDDLGQAVNSVQAACMQIFGNRVIGGKNLSDSVRLMAATNRREDMAGVKGLLEPVKSRFGMIVELVADVDIWSRWATAQGIFQPIIDHVNYNPVALHDFKPNTGMENSPCPRLWEKLSGQLLFADKKNISPEIREKMVIACVGESHGSQFCAFEKIYRQLPTYDQAISDEDFDMPNRLDILFAFCGMLASKAKQIDEVRVFDLVDLMPPACQMYIYKTMGNINPGMLDTARARLWATQNVSLLMD